MPYWNTIQNQSVPNIGADPQAPLWGVLGLQSGTGGGGAAQNYLEDPQSVLARVIQYDPNAHLEPFTYYGPEGVENRQQVVYDQSKLPQPKYPGAVFSGATPLFNPQAVQRDPNYGNVTSPLNLNLRQNDSTWLDVVGPLLVGGAIGLGGGFSALGSLFSKLPNVASMVSNMTGPSAQSITPQQLALFRLMQGH